MNVIGFTKPDITNNSVNILIKYGGKKMKAMVLVIAIAAVLLIGGVFVAATWDKPTDTTKTIKPTSSTCSSGQGCPTGGCSATNNCGLSTCGATTGGGCGCGK